MKLEINYKKKTGKFANMLRLNNMILSNLVKEEVKRKFLKKIRQMRFGQDGGE